MGCGSWTTSSFASYSATKKMTVNSRGEIDSNLDARQMFKQRYIHEDLDVRGGKVRECCDNEEHPNTVPVILALDVTGSMGDGATTIANKLNTIITDIMKEVKDVEFSVVAIGDVECDDEPLQMSQFESDVRIAHHLDKIYFEAGGGGNGYESYTLAWYAGLRHANLDCWKRGKKGIIITMGDEPLNPILPTGCMKSVLQEKLQSDVKTQQLYREASEKYDIYHLSIDDKSTSYRYQNGNKSSIYYEHAAGRVDNSYNAVLPEGHYKVVGLDALASTIANIVKECAASNESNPVTLNESEITPFDSGVISW